MQRIIETVLIWIMNSSWLKVEGNYYYEEPHHTIWNVGVEVSQMISEVLSQKEKQKKQMPIATVWFVCLASFVLICLLLCY